MTGFFPGGKKGHWLTEFNTEHQTDMSEIKEVLEDALRVSKDSQGAFDLTVLPLSQLWNFDRFGDSDFDVSTMEVPDQADIARGHEESGLYTASVIMMRQVSFPQRILIFRLSLGAIGKGYAIEQAKDDTDIVQMHPAA